MLFTHVSSTRIFLNRWFRNAEQHLNTCWFFFFLFFLTNLHFSGLCAIFTHNTPEKWSSLLFAWDRLPRFNINLKLYLYTNACTGLFFYIDHAISLLSHVVSTSLLFFLSIDYESRQNTTILFDEMLIRFKFRMALLAIKGDDLAVMLGSERRHEWWKIS